MSAPVVYARLAVHNPGCPRTLVDYLFCVQHGASIPYPATLFLLLVLLLLLDRNARAASVTGSTRYPEQGMKVCGITATLQAEGTKDKHSIGDKLR